MRRRGRVPHRLVLRRLTALTASTSTPAPGKIRTTSTLSQDVAASSGVNPSLSAACGPRGRGDGRALARSYEVTWRVMVAAQVVSRPRTVELRPEGHRRTDGSTTCRWVWGGGACFSCSSSAMNPIGSTSWSRSCGFVQTGCFAARGLGRCFAVDRLRRRSGHSVF